MYVLIYSKRSLSTHFPTPPYILSFGRYIFTVGGIKKKPIQLDLALLIKYNIRAIQACHRKSQVLSCRSLFL